MRGCSGRAPLVMMMESANVGDFDNLSTIDFLEKPLAEGQRVRLPSRNTHNYLLQKSWCVFHLETRNPPEGSSSPRNGERGPENVEYWGLSGWGIMVGSVGGLRNECVILD